MIKNEANQMKNRYQKAENFLPWNLQAGVLNSAIFPYWTETALYYFQENVQGKKLIKVDYQTGAKENILEYTELMNSFFKFFPERKDLICLALDKFSMQENPIQINISHDSKIWSYDVAKKVFTSRELKPEYLISPNGAWSLNVKHYNLFITDLTTNNNYQLTIDGQQYYDYASSPETNTRAVSQRIEKTSLMPIALWSSDSRKVITHKLDQRKVATLSLLQNAPAGSQRPIVHDYRMSFSGDADLPLAELVIVDTIDKTVIPLKTDAQLSPYLTPLEFKWVWWAADNEKIYFLKDSRGSKELMLCMADANTGEVETLITETAEHTYIEPSQHFLWIPQVIVLEHEREIIWLSERSGYSHLYLYEMGNITPKNAITRGDWCVREVHFYDSVNKWLYFTACGFSESIDPYYKQLFRCRLNGAELQCLTQENAHHTIVFSPNRSCFLDTYSTISEAPVSFLKRLDGQKICHLETADIYGLQNLNWHPPQRLCLKARDDITKIYGNIYFPADFDSNKKYPIIDHIYPGPQFYRATPHFNLYGFIFRSAWLAQALAELGFIVVHIDGLGTPGRSKAFHDVTYKNMGDCSLADHVTAIQQLAKKYEFIDLERVGITGYSGGGYAAARAMLMYPDFFHVAVAAGGNHDLRCYPASYGEKYNSLDVTTYAEQSNVTHAQKLKGKLFLVHGEMDDNVHPCATWQLVDALIKHNKDFDLLIMPNQNHRATFDHPYYMRRHWDYFVKHLLNQNPPQNYIIKPMPADFPQLMDW